MTSASPVMQISSLLIGVMHSTLHTPPVTTSSMTGDQVAPRARWRHSLFGSCFWRPTIVEVQDVVVKAVSAVPTYGVSDGWLHRTLGNVAFFRDSHRLFRVAESLIARVERRTRFVNTPVCITAARTYRCRTTRLARLRIPIASSTRGCARPTA